MDCAPLPECKKWARLSGPILLLSYNKRNHWATNMWRVSSPQIVFILLTLSLTARAQYNVAYADLTPAGALGGSLVSTSGNQQAGSFTTSAGSFAGLWNGPSDTFVSLHPAGVTWTWSWVLAAAGNQQAGATYSVGLWAHHAAIWSGTPASYRDLNPGWSTDSQVTGTTGTRQAGYVTTPDFQSHAALWSGTASSFIDLNPPGANSVAHAIGGEQQVGVVSLQNGTHAAIWAGSAASFRDLNPTWASYSELRATTGSRQVGWAGAPGGFQHAGLWSGTAESFVDLNPEGALWSEALGITGTAQAGFAVLNSYRHALLWFGSADNYIDLQSSLGDLYRESQARSIWTDGNTILVAGDATDWSGTSHPMLWTLTAIPEPGTIPLSALAFVVWAARARKRINAQLAAK